MKHSTHLVSTTEALRLVFLPTLRPVAKPSRPPFVSPTHHHYATAPPAGAFNMAGRFVRANKTSQSTDKRPRNEQIRARQIHLVEPSGKLGPPQLLSLLLRTLDPRKEFLEQLDTHEETQIPVCKVVNKAEAREVAKAAKARKKAQPSQVTKYLEINWAIDRNDLEHRLGKLREFLEGGRRVEVVLMKKKKRMRDASEGEGRATLEAVEGFVRGVEGAREMRPMEGVFLGRATLFFEGKVKKAGGKELGEANGGEEKASVKEERDTGGEHEEEEPVKAAGYG